MKKFLLSLALFLGLISTASAQCVGAGGINNVPQPGIVCASEPIAVTFAASTSGFAIASTATDVACLTGSATKTVRVQQVRVSGTAGTQIIIPAILVRRATVDSAGTSVVMTPYAMDTNNVASTVSAVAYYTANPTINDTAPNMLDVGSWLLGTTAGVNGLVAPYTLFDWTERNFMQAPIIRGTSQQLCINVNGTSPSASLAQISFKWTELSQ